MIDLHVHTGFCPHGRGTFKEYLEAASEKNLSYLGFAEHLPLPPGYTDPVGDSALTRETFKQYVSQVTEIKDADEHILLGGELDFLPGHKKWAKKLSQYPDLDYVIGSLHFLGGWCFDYSEEAFREGLQNRYAGDAEGFIKEYCKNMGLLLSICDVDVVGHLDLYKKFNEGEK
ncbi:MAG: histidinol-phosphatase HisJ family protein, partial [Candidatus Altiarchaeales archaeon]|nr:histidinol-phosphatase HisJ family protein [Candidatus Altiarchaeales archaeon]